MKINLPRSESDISKSSRQKPVVNHEPAPNVEPNSLAPKAAIDDSVTANQDELADELDVTSDEKRILKLKVAKLITEREERIRKIKVAKETKEAEERIRKLQVAEATKEAKKRLKIKMEQRRIEKRVRDAEVAKLAKEYERKLQVAKATIEAKKRLQLKMEARLIQNRIAPKINAARVENRLPTKPPAVKQKSAPVSRNTLPPSVFSWAWWKTELNF